MWRVRPRAIGHLRDAACVGYVLGHLCSRLLGAAFATGTCAAGGWARLTLVCAQARQCRVRRRGLAS
eukprot:1076131-Alexandrium_andersonii.AAC.1